MKEHMPNSGAPHWAEIWGACPTGFRPIYKYPSWKHPNVGLPSWAHVLCRHNPVPSHRAEKDSAAWLRLCCHCLEIVNNFFKRGAPHFHFVLDLTNEVADLPEASLAGDLLLPLCAPSFSRALELSISLSLTAEPQVYPASGTFSSILF